MATHYRLIVGIAAVASVVAAGVYFAPAIENQITLFRAEAYDEEYKWHEAGPLYLKASEYYRERQQLARWAETFGNAARCYVGIDRTADVINRFDDVAGYWESVGAPESALPYYLDGGAYWKETERHAEAIQSFNRAASHYATVGDSLDEAKIRVHIAESHVALEQPVEARLSYLLAVRAAKERSQPRWLGELAQLYKASEAIERAAALSAAGRIYLRTPWWDRAGAVPYLEAAISAAPQADDYELLSQLYFDLDQIDDASRTLANLVRAYPERSFGHYGIGVVAWHNGQIALAEEHLGRASRLDASYDSTYRSVVEHREAVQGQRAAQAELKRLNGEFLGRALQAGAESIAFGFLFKRLRVPSGLRTLATVSDAVSFAREERDHFAERQAAFQAAARAELELQSLPKFVDADYQLQILFDRAEVALQEAAATPLEGFQTP